jgi:hypothetical protein
MPLTSFVQVGQFIDHVLTINNQIGAIRRAPHQDFWNRMSYHDFTTGNIPNVLDQGQPIRILIPGDPDHSNLIDALKGTGIFDPKTGSQDRMPANGPPFFTDAQISEIAQWVRAGCPQ